MTRSEAHPHAPTQPSGAAPELATAILACADELTREVVADIYEDPFWEARFGARGRRYSEEDGRYHLTYLAQALSAGEAGDAGVLCSYAQWLRTVLVSRGMCSLHLAENYERLAAALHERPLAGVGRAVSFLEQAAAALRYEVGPAAVVQRRFDELLERAELALALTRAQREGQSATAPLPSRDGCRRELGYYLSYLADALASSRPELFAKHLQWSTAFLARQASAQRLPQASELLRALEQAIADAADPELATITAPIVSAAREIAAGV